MTSIYMPSSSTSGGGSSELAGQVYGNTSNTIISTAAVTNKQLTGLSSMTGAVTASDTILTGISKLSGNAGAATSDNTANTIVKRDGSGDFAANKIRVNNIEPNGTTLNIASDDTTTTLNLGSSASVQTINVGNSGTGKTTIKLGGGTDEVLVNMPLKDTLGASILNVVNDNTHVGKDISVAGTFNTAVGTSALKGVTTDATLNTAVGVRSLEWLTTGTHNVAMGYRAGSVGTALTTGTKCTLIGADARTTTVNMTNSTAIGYTAVVDADNCIQLGNPGITAVKTSGTLYAAGLESSGATPTILNIASLNNTNTVNIGSGAGVQAINVGNSGNGKTTIKLGGGTDEVQVNLPLKESVNGFNILSITSDASAGNTSLGSKAMASWTGTANTYIGSDIASLGTGAAWGNTVVGSNAMKWVSTGSNNCAMGHKSLESLTTGANNVAIGYRTGFDAGSRNLTTGNQNVLIGSEARTTTGTMNNAIAIGYMSLVDADNTIQLGNPSIIAVKTSGTLYAAGLESIGTNSTLTIAGSDNTKVVEIGKGTGVQVINIGSSGAGATSINIGSGLDTVNFSGTENNITGNLKVTGTGTNGTVKARSLIQLDSWIPPAAQGSGISWNRISGSGSTTFINHHGLGSAGGWEWMNYNNDNTPTSANPQMTLDKSGNLAVTGSLSTSVVPTTANHLTNKTYVDGKVTAIANQNLKTTDVVTFGGLILPNVGGLATTLNYYEEYEFNTGFNIAGASLSTIGIVRIGKLVNMCVKTGVNVTASGSAPFYSITALPPRFRPVAALNTFIEIYYNGARNTGVATINPTGIIDIFRTNGEYFTYGVNAGFIPFYMSWVV